MYREIKGDLIQMALEGKFDAITHGCNCQSTMGAGIALSMKNTFGCDRFEMEIGGSTIEKLGNIDYKTFVLGEYARWPLEDGDNKLNDPELTIINSYTQNRYGREFGIPFDYEAFTLCARKINHIFKGKHIGLPKIGCGLAGAEWTIVKQIIQREMQDVDVTVVIF